MTSLPQSIETYLIEAGFSGTEILLLKRLLEADAMTLRELAAKTGKSTGVLDQATKKLIRKNILKREVINDSPRYVLSSLDAIAEWVKQDMRQKRDAMKRKQDDFESFIATLKKDQARPDMRYFEGAEGMQQAYRTLLTEGKDFLVYLPVTFKEEEDPLRAFRVDFFRDRRKFGIFSRVITHNTPLGRRYQSRDPFEYRKTMLLPEDDLPLTFEKIIVGDTIACFNHETQKACLLHYPELAHTERSAFEMIWKAGQIVAAGQPQSVSTPPDYNIPISTKTASALREFFLSRKSLWTFALCAILAGGITYGMYAYTLNLMKNEVKQNLLSIAATTAPDFNAEDLSVLHLPRDMQKPEYQRVFERLNAIRDRNENIKYVYIMRPTDSDEIWEFVADADSNYNIPFYTEASGDDVLNEYDENVAPGVRYALRTNILVEALKQPITEEDFLVEQWGVTLSGHAPIKDAKGNSVAVLGIDIDVSHLYSNIRAQFIPHVWFISSFLILLLARLVYIMKTLQISRRRAN